MPTDLRTMHRPRWAIAARLALLLACGSTVVTIHVDIMSFLTSEEMSIRYGDNPVIPGGGPEVSLRTPAETIPLPNELNTVTEISAVEIEAQADFRNDTGSTTLAYRIYFDSPGGSIFDTPPVVDREVVLAPGTELHHEILLEGDHRVIHLFEGDEMLVASEVRVIHGGGTGNISGTVELTGLTVQVSAIREE